MLNQAISVPKVFQGDNSQGHRGARTESDENQKSQNHGFSTATTQQLPIAVGI